MLIIGLFLCHFLLYLFDSVMIIAYNEEQQVWCGCRQHLRKEQKNSTFFKAVKERKLGQLANEPLKKYVSALASNGVRL